jgi:hypothetical protein
VGIPSRTTDRELARHNASRSPKYTGYPRFDPGPLTDVDKLRLQVGQLRLEHEGMEIRALLGNPAAVAALPGHTEKLRRLTLDLERLEGTMSTIENRDKALSRWRGLTMAPAAELAKLNADAPKLPPEWVASERKRLLEAIRIGDVGGRDAVKQYLTGAATEAALLRAAYEGEGDPGRAVADELAAARLAKGNGDDLVRSARRLIEAGQPEAARKFILALDLVEPKPKLAGQAKNEYQVAMQDAAPTLRAASAVERTARDAAVAFEVERNGFLADSGLGLDMAGEVGSGQPGQAGRASMRRTLRRWEADPEGYSEPAPDGGRADGRPEEVHP